MLLPEARCFEVLSFAQGLPPVVFDGPAVPLMPPEEPLEPVVPAVPFAPAAPFVPAALPEAAPAAPAPAPPPPVPPLPPPPPAPWANASVALPAINATDSRANVVLFINASSTSPAGQQRHDWLLVACVFVFLDALCALCHESSVQSLPESLRVAYAATVRNNRKEVIQCLIVYRRGRRHS